VLAIKRHGVSHFKCLKLAAADGMDIGLGTAYTGIAAMGNVSTMRDFDHGILLG
jgi:hypothetical protein